MSLLFRNIIDPNTVRVQLQKKYLSKDLLTVKLIITHPNFYIFQNGADIALLELTHPVNISSSIRPVSLPPASMNFPSDPWCWVTGWGRIGQNGMW